MTETLNQHPFLSDNKHKKEEKGKKEGRERRNEKGIKFQIKIMLKKVFFKV